MFQRLFAWKQKPQACRRLARPRLEQLEARELLDAAGVATLNAVAYYTSLTEQQMVQAIRATQQNFATFQMDSIALSAGLSGATSAKVNQDVFMLKLDLQTLQQLANNYQQEKAVFVSSMNSVAGLNLSAQDGAMAYWDAEVVMGGAGVAFGALETLAQVAAIVPQAAPPPLSMPTTSTSASTSASATTDAPLSTTSDPTTSLVTLNLNPINANVLGLQLQTSAIQVKISAQSGQGDLLGNALSGKGSQVVLQAANSILNNVLGTVVNLVNTGTLNVAGASTSSGPLSSSASATTTPVLSATIAPVHLNLLGVLVDTSPIQLTLTAHSGQGLVLGNVLTDLANLFNPPLPSTLTLTDINNSLAQLLSDLNTQLPNIPSAPVTTTTIPAGSNQVLDVSLAPINLNLLGLILKTSQIEVNASATTGNGDLLGNLTTTAFNTLGATPQSISTLNNNLNALLAKVVGVLNAATLTLDNSVLGSLNPTLQSLTAAPTPSGATAPILNLSIASTNSTSPPVDVNLLGLVVTTSDVQAQLLAQTGSGEVLGNLLYATANLLNPPGTSGLLSLLGTLGL